MKYTLILILTSFHLFASQYKNFDLHSGDLIFRKENGFLSNLFSQIDNSDYSHIGIILIQDNKAFVYHMERTDAPHDLKIVDINSFLENMEKVKFLRIKKEISSEKLKDILSYYKKIDPKFDMDFTLKNGDKNLYCTEFVNEVFLKLINENIYSYLYKNFKTKGISIKSILQNDKLFDEVGEIKNQFD